MRCATRRSRRASGAASTSTITRSTSSASWTSWRMRSAQDPLEFRRKYAASRSTLAVLNAVADKAGWGKPAPQGVYRGIAQYHGLRQLCRGGAPRSRSASRPCQDPPHRRRRPIPATPSTRRRSSGRSRARSSTASRRCSTARCTVKDGAHRADEFRYLPRDADRRDAEGRVRRHARPATSGAASASRPSRWRRRRCSTPSSRRPASASATSRSRTTT